MSYKYEDYRTFAEDQMNALNDMYDMQNEHNSNVGNALNSIYQIGAETNSAISQMLSITENREQFEQFKHQVKNQVYKLNEYISQNGANSGVETHLFIKKYRNWIADNQITVDLFDSIEDKDYFKNTHQSIVSYHQGILAGMSPEEIEYFDTQALSDMDLIEKCANSFALYGSFFSNDKITDNDTFVRLFKCMIDFADENDKGNAELAIENYKNDFLNWSVEAEQNVYKIKEETLAKKSFMKDNQESSLKKEIEDKTLDLSLKIMWVFGVMTILASSLRYTSSISSFIGALIGNVVGIGIVLYFAGPFISLMYYPFAALYMKFKYKDSGVEIREKYEESTKKINDECSKALESIETKKAEFLEELKKIKSLAKVVEVQSMKAREEAQSLLEDNKIKMFDTLGNETYKWQHIFYYIGNFKGQVAVSVGASCYEEVIKGEFDYKTKVKEYGSLFSHVQQRMLKFVDCVENNHGNKKIAA